MDDGFFSRALISIYGGDLNMNLKIYFSAEGAQNMLAFHFFFGFFYFFLKKIFFFDFQKNFDFGKGLH